MNADSLGPNSGYARRSLYYAAIDRGEELGILKFGVEVIRLSEDVEPDPRHCWAQAQHTSGDSVRVFGTGREELMAGTDIKAVKDFCRLRGFTALRVTDANSRHVA